MRSIEIKKNTENVLSFIETNVFPKLRNPEIYDYICFTQVWGSTALGFGGWGGSMMTTALTTIVEVESDNKDNTVVSRWYVFFDGQFAYYVDGGNEKFIEDKAKGCMVDCSIARTRYNSNSLDTRENKKEAK